MTGQGSATQKPPTCLRNVAALWTGTEVATGVDIGLASGRIVTMERSSPGPIGASDIDASGLIAMPGLVDCHTHAVWSGTRLGDFVRRQSGESYAAILEGGGGIHTTVAATRAASDTLLRELCRARLDAMLAGGVTTVEIKSGYGLTVGDEARLLRVARESAGPQRVVTTFLGAHAIPADRNRAEYVDEVCGPMLAACLPYADGIDVYCDRGAFTLPEAERILRAGKAAGLAVHAHAEQVEASGVAAVAACLGALSCDHLERVDDAGIEAMAAAGTVAVLLPGAMLYLHDSAPPIARLRAAGVPLAVATDFNPGSSPVRDLWTCATLACLTMGLSPEEALAGITLNAALALGRRDLGRLQVGAAADVALYRPPPGEVADPRVLVQYLGGHRAEMVFIDGTRVR
ncbi:MAG: imidazolonepropionase [Myxococcales bacterium]|nr:imidazolonepropionase [Myxococcales bacterium]